jgi:hypothetical protein
LNSTRKRDTRETQRYGTTHERKRAAAMLARDRAAPTTKTVVATQTVMTKRGRGRHASDEMRATRIGPTDMSELGGKIGNLIYVASITELDPDFVSRPRKVDGGSNFFLIV